MIDVGCNDGSLLNYFKKAKYKTIGIEPTGAVKDINKGHEIYNSTLNVKIVKKILKNIRILLLLHLQMFLLIFLILLN